MTEELKNQIEEFRIKTEQFANGEISVKDYKGFSGKFGSYAQRGGKSSMVRLRMTGGRLDKNQLKKIIDICDKYNIEKLHCTTCQTIQLHDIPLNITADVLTDAVNAGFYTLGGGGDFPRNVMVSPLSGVEKDEYFDVFPYAQKASEYLLTMINAVKMPRKLKVCFSNSPQNAVHATFRDLGFTARSDGKFDVYCAGGMGSNPKMGVKVDEGVEGSKIIYYIKAMIDLFCEYGNYENRSKARTRYMQDTLGDKLKDEFNKKLKNALESGGLDISVSEEKITKHGAKLSEIPRRVIEQKQDGLYTIKFHPIGGIITPQALKKLYDAIKDIDDVSLRVSPDMTVYIVNCNKDEAIEVLRATDGGAEKDIEQSVACIGAGICQQGLRNSQELLDDILNKIRPYDFAPDALPVLHISGCISSCGTHPIGSIGFHGKVKMVDKKPVSGYTINIDGCDVYGHERFGEELGVMAADDIPEFIVDLGNAVTNQGMSYKEFADKKTDLLKEIISKYI